MKVFVFILLLAMCGSAWAERTSVASGDGVEVYVDMSTIRKKGSMVKMWSLLDFKTVQGVGQIPHLSEKAQEEYDCDEERYRTVYFSDHAENMGAGKVPYIHSDPDMWRPISPRSISETLWKIACGK